MSVFSRTRNSLKGVSSDAGNFNFSAYARDQLDSNSLANWSVIPKVYTSEIAEVPVPENLAHRNNRSSFHTSLYAKASYYFYNCSILSTVILRIQQEALKNGIAWKAKFQSKCPKCETEYPRTTRKCMQCGHEGEMITPDVSQQKLLINYEGKSLIQRANRSGWSLLQLCRSFLIITLTYNQPVFLCKSTYLIDSETKTVIDEFPQEFIPMDPSKCKRIFDGTGQPGDGWGFTIDNRHARIPLDSPEILKTGYHDGERVYPAHWVITVTDGGAEGAGEAYSEREIFHTTYGLPSLNYGMPLSLLVESAIKAWMALELRVEKYYSVGHPSGIFVITNVTTESLATVQQSIRLQMKDDPFTIPVIGVPPSSDKVTTTKWHQFGDNPTEQMMSVKFELQERVSAIYGMNGFFIGDSRASSSNSNDVQQMAILDRNLVSIRSCVDEFLAFIISKYKGITHWDLVVSRPPDNQSLDEAEKFNKNLMNAKMAKDIGFDVISQADGNVELSDTPRSYDPIKSIFADAGGAEGQGVDEEDESPLNVMPDYGMSKISVSDNFAQDSFLSVDKGRETVTVDKEFLVTLLKELASK